MNKQVTPEYIPILSDDVFDVSNFDTDYVRQKPRLSKVTKQTKDMIKEHQDKFDGFDS